MSAVNAGYDLTFEYMFSNVVKNGNISDGHSICPESLSGQIYRGIRTLPGETSHLLRN